MMDKCETYTKEGMCCCQCARNAIVKKWAYQDVNWRIFVCTYFYDVENGPLIYNEGHGLCECFEQKEDSDEK